MEEPPEEPPEEQNFLDKYRIYFIGAIGCLILYAVYLYFSKNGYCKTDGVVVHKLEPFYDRSEFIGVVKHPRHSSQSLVSSVAETVSSVAEIIPSDCALPKISSKI